MRLLHNKKAFTLIEMILVLFVIAILMLLIIPNISTKKQKIDQQGTAALANMIQGQVELYALENNQAIPSLDTLAAEGYLNDKQVSEALERHISVSGDGQVVYPQE